MCIEGCLIFSDSCSYFCCSWQFLYRKFYFIVVHVYPVSFVWYGLNSGDVLSLDIMVKGLFSVTPISQDSSCGSGLLVQLI